jgi:hypothetical protein
LIEENETNENEMNIEEHVERVESENVWIENNKVEEHGEQIMKKNLQKLHVQRKNWIGHNINSTMWMMGKRLKLNPIKSWNVFYVMIVM